MVQAIDGPAPPRDRALASWSDRSPMPVRQDAVRESVQGDDGSSECVHGIPPEICVMGTTNGRVETMRARHRIFSGR